MYQDIWQLINNVIYIGRTGDWEMITLRRHTRILAAGAQDSSSAHFLGIRIFKAGCIPFQFIPFDIF
jgi:hypothetical protein